jgi:multidrug efflux system membrane fusion protein
MANNMKPFSIVELPILYPMKSFHLQTWGSLSLLLVSLALSGCSDKGNAAKPKGKEAIPVTIATATEKAIPLQLRAIGTGEAYAVVAIKAQVGGILTGVFFREGKDVKAGELLFKIDSRPFEAALMQAEANLAKDRAQLKQAQAKLAADLAQVKQANANSNRNSIQARQSEAESQRYASLYAKGAISKNQYEQFRSTAEAMNASTVAGNAGVESAEAAVQADLALIESAVAAINADQALIDNAKVQLTYTAIVSPIDGRTGSLMVNQGNVVKANDTTPMVTINQLRPIYVNFAIPQQKLSEVRRYMQTGNLKVEAILGKDEAHPIRGKLTFIDNTVDSTTGTVKLKGTFDNTDTRLWPGQFVNVVLTLGTESKAIAIPSQAVQTGQKGQFVYVLTPDSTVEIKPVVVSRTINNEAVIETGLDPGEQVVTDGILKLVPGAKVTVNEAEEKEAK